MPSGLNSFFGKNEFPRHLQTWRKNINDNQNPGLALRWVAALAEMEPTLAIPTDDWQRANRFWRSKVVEEISKHPRLQYFTDAEDTRSIVSLCLIDPRTQTIMSNSDL